MKPQIKIRPMQNLLGIAFVRLVARLYSSIFLMSKHAFASAYKSSRDVPLIQRHFFLVAPRLLRGRLCVPDISYSFTIQQDCFKQYILLIHIHLKRKISDLNTTFRRAGMCFESSF